MVLFNNRASNTNKATTVTINISEETMVEVLIISRTSSSSHSSSSKISNMIIKKRIGVEIVTINQDLQVDIVTVQIMAKSKINNNTKTEGTFNQILVTSISAL